MIWYLISCCFRIWGGHPLSGLAVSSGTNAIFYAVVNLASEGDNIVAARALYGGTFTMFNDILPKFGILGEYLVYLVLMCLSKASTIDALQLVANQIVKFVDAENPQNFVAAMDK